MKNLKTLSIIAIVLIGLFATSCTPENLDNDQTEQQIDRTQKYDLHKTDKNLFLMVACCYFYMAITPFLFYSYKSFPDKSLGNFFFYTRNSILLMV